MQSLTKTSLSRGIRNHCPACGKGKILKKYTAPHKECPACHLNYDELRADDGPAWATILITGHLTMPFIFWLLELELDNMAIEITLPILLILVLSAIILPIAKSTFMAIIWMTHIRKNSADDIQDDIKAE